MLNIRSEIWQQSLCILYIQIICNLSMGYDTFFERDLTHLFTFDFILQFLAFIEKLAAFSSNIFLQKKRVVCYYFTNSYFSIISISKLFVFIYSSSRLLTFICKMLKNGKTYFERLVNNSGFSKIFGH